MYTCIYIYIYIHIYIYIYIPVSTGLDLVDGVVADKGLADEEHQVRIVDLMVPGIVCLHDDFTVAVTSAQATVDQMHVSGIGTHAYTLTCTHATSMRKHAQT